MYHQHGRSVSTQTIATSAPVWPPAEEHGEEDQAPEPEPPETAPVPGPQAPVPVSSPAPHPPSSAPANISGARPKVRHQCMFAGCTKSFSQRGDLVRHEGSHEGSHEGTVFKCDKCPSTFTLKKNLVRHLNAHTDGFMCNVCGTKMSSKQALAAHLNIHTEERPYLCPNPGCNKAYSTKGNLKKHLAGCGLSSEEKKTIQCPGCPTRVSTKDALKYHLQSAHTHHGAYVCPRCAKALNSRGALKLHVCSEGYTLHV